MYLLIACAGSWLILLGSFFTAWTQLPPPRTTGDIIVIVIIGSGVLLFSRIGIVSLLALLLRVLPSGRVRSTIAGLVVRVMPRILASSVLAVISAGLAVHSVHAAPVGDSAPGPASSPDAASAPADPGWPTVGDHARSPTPADNVEGSDVEEPPEESEAADRLLPPDPGWPAEPPDERPSDTSDEADDESHQADAPDHSGNPNEPDENDDSSVPADSAAAAHTVTRGESLWSIAAELTDTPAEVPQLVADIYTANEDTIGPDPSLIIAGQRLEIRT